MKQPKWYRLTIFSVLALMAVLVWAARKPAADAPNAGEQGGVTEEAGAPATPAVGDSTAASADRDGKRPRLVDLGAGKCIPCQMMAPILEELKKEQAGTIDVEFIDVWENPEAGQRFGIRAIPTQIFYDAEGKEFYRHEGFLSKEDILARFREHGIEPAKAGAGS
ncbi:MAG: thioredoxin family protein [Armatimonadota bacterium]|nr:thioredoxin family protein [Armatimonadota bacterium]